MESKQSKLINDFLPNLKTFIKSETVFGEAYTLGEVSIIPVNSVKVGFAFGEAGTKKVEPQGAGGGVTLSPVAFIVVKDGDVSIHSLNAGTIENVMGKVPEVVDRFVSVFKKAQGKSTHGDSDATDK